jgi:putative ABC transport system permease protein
MTGFFHVKYGINKFLAGIIVVAICFTASLRIMGASNIGLINHKTIFDTVAHVDKLVPDLHTGSILLLAAMMLVGIVLLYAGLSSNYGIRLRVAGSNPE